MNKNRFTQEANSQRNTSLNKKNAGHATTLKISSP